MLKYYCETCGQELSPKLIDKNTNKCLICKANLDKLYDKYRESSKLEEKKLLNDARISFNESYVKHLYTIYWSKKGNVPVFSEYIEKYKENCEKVSSDIRPVFPEEQLLIEILLDEQHEILGKSVWYTSGNDYIVDGKKIKISKPQLQKKNPEKVAERFYQRKQGIDYTLFQEVISEFVALNDEWFRHLRDEAIENIKRIASEYNDDEIFISFSGGKDSTVVSDLVIKSLLHRNIPRIFGDTTLEFPSTYEYIERIKEDSYTKDYSKVITTKNKHDDFFELCDIVGPPSRVMRWCCTYFKTTPISDRIDAKFKNKKKILSFQGIRRNESASRSKYDMETDSPKISKQRVFAPIIDWFDFDVWLYILSSGIDFNEAYRFGYSRVGCWNCPNNSDWAMYLSKIYIPALSAKWHTTLMNFALKTDKENPESYVEDNSWKARQGGKGLDIAENTITNVQPCVTEANSFNYQLTKPINEGFYNLFKPFGYLDFTIGNKRKNEVYVVSKNGIPCLRLQGKIGTSLLKVTILSIKDMGGISKKLKNVDDAKMKIDCQITKFQTCISCFGCKSACKFDAITIRNKTKFDNETGTYEVDVEYRIDDDKCVRCGECIDHFGNGCYMKKVLRTKKETEDR